MTLQMRLALYGAVERLRGRSVLYSLRTLRQSAWWDRQRLRAWQVEQLRELLIHCQRNVPFYAEVFEKFRFDPYRLQSLTDLQRLPVLKKDEVAKNFDRLLARDAREWRPVREFTGGTSTGRPLAFFKDALSESWTRALVYRAYEWYGLDTFPRVCTVSGWSGRELGMAGRLWRKLRARLLGSSVLYVPPDADEAYLERTVRWLIRFDPQLLYGYPSRLLRLGRAVSVLNIRPKNLKALEYSSEILFEPEKKRLEWWWGCPVYCAYGATECYVSVECPEERRLHLVEPAIVEFLDDKDQPAEPGKPGRVVVTPLFARVMPFIRYDLGDVAIAGGDEVCPCGRQLPLMGPVLGRADQVVRTLDGRKLYAKDFGDAITACGDLRDFRVYVDEDAGKLRVHLVPALTGNPVELKRAVRERLEAIVGAGFGVEVQVVEALEPTPGHKRRPLKCVRAD